jgi:hypothetical protein
MSETDAQPTKETDAQPMTAERSAAEKNRSERCR